MMAFDMVDHLNKVVGKALEVDVSGGRRPPEVEVILLVVVHFQPEVATGLLHYAAYKGTVVPVKDLVLKLPPSLCFVGLQIKVRRDILIKHLGSSTQHHVFLNNLVQVRKLLERCRHEC